MLLNYKQQQQPGLIVEDEALGIMGFFSTNPNSNSLASLLPHQSDSNSHGNEQESLKYSFAGSPMNGGDDGDVDVDNDTPEQHHHHHHHRKNSRSGLCEALWFPCANNNNPKPRDVLHQDPSSISHSHLLSLHQSSNSPNPCLLREWGCSGRESMGSRAALFDEEDYHENNNIDDDDDDGDMNMEKKNKKSDGLGVSGHSKKMKAAAAGRRKVREPRFSFKTLSDVDVLDDGYKWRKYGQKVVKNTHHPRSYYRCTQEKCRVKKRVERLAEDPRMVITTYEGRHAHSPAPQEEEHRRHSNITNFFFF
ncbi:hypothetical protein V2J09_021955 [Rumex salicifolius]